MARTTGKRMFPALLQLPPPARAGLGLLGAVIGFLAGLGMGSRSGQAFAATFVLMCMWFTIVSTALLWGTERQRTRRAVRPTKQTLRTVRIAFGSFFIAGLAAFLLSRAAG